MKTHFRLKILAYANLFFCMLLLTTCHKTLNPASDYMIYDKNEGLVGNGGGQITLAAPGSSMNGTIIEIPQGALNSENRINIKIDNSIRPLGDSLAEVIKFEPDGLTFNKPISLKIPINNSIQYPKLFYFNPDSNIVEQIPIVEYNKAKNLISSEINHFSRYYIEDATYAFFDAKLYKNPGNSIKANLKFGGASGLFSIKTSTVSQLFSNYPNNARQVVIGSVPRFYPAVKIMAKIRVDLLTGGWLGSKTLSSKYISVQKNGNSTTEFYVKIFDGSDNQFVSPNLTSQTIEDFFSGKALIIDFGIVPLYGSGIKYYLKLSWSLGVQEGADDNYRYSRVTNLYKVNTYDDHPWEIADMINLDPDKNNNSVDDSYDLLYKPNADFTGTPRIIKIGQSVQFRDQSTNNPTSTLYNFGDGETSAFQNPLHTYNKLGLFTVSLTASNRYGSDIETKTDYITVINIPTVSTNEISNPNPKSAIVGWNVTSSGGGTVSEHGIYWSTSFNPVSTGTKLPIGSGTGIFSTTLDGLTPDKIYYIRAYAINNVGTAYGDPVSFKTPTKETIPINGLVAYYPFNGNANDQSGNNNNGTVHGAILTADRHGISNRAYLFNGVDNYIEINHSSSLNLSQQISISFWAKFETSAPYYYPYHIIGKYGCWGIGQRESDIHAGITTSAGDLGLWSLYFDFDRFYHIVMTYDASNLRLYIDGTLKESIAATGLLIQNSNNIFISKYQLSDSYYFFDGVLDDFRIYNRALTQQEITSLSNE